MGAVGILIITWNSEAVIGSCLDAALRTSATILVVDNASEDGTRDQVARRGVSLIANPVNRGFAAAANQGIRALDAAYILLLNPDATLETGIEMLRECCDRPAAAGAAGLLLDQQGRAQVGFMVRRFPSPLALVFEALLLNRLWPRNPVNWNYRCLGLDFTRILEVDQPAGAFLMIRRDVWEQLGGFDEAFFPLWFEDVDFCRRAQQHGFHMYYHPSAVAKHTGGHSIPKILLEMRQFYWYRSLLRYSAKHFSFWEARLVCLAILAGSILRMVVTIAASRSPKFVTVYGRVLRLAGRFLFSGRLGGTEALSFPLS